MSEAYLRKNAICHSGFEAKQKMKPYYCSGTFHTAILRKFRINFFRMESAMWVIIQNTKCTNILYKRKPASIIFNILGGLNCTFD